MGKMQCAKHGHSVHEASNRMQRILVRKNCSYHRMLDKCVVQVYRDSDGSD